MFEFDRKIVYLATVLRRRFILLLATALGGCAEPPAAPPQEAPWLNSTQQIQLLRQQDDRLRILAARNLGNLGSEGAGAISELEKLTHDTNPRVQAAASEALEKIRAAIGEATP